MFDIKSSKCVDILLIVQVEVVQLDNKDVSTNITWTNIWLTNTKVYFIYFIYLLVICYRGKQASMLLVIIYWHKTYEWVLQQFKLDTCLLDTIDKEEVKILCIHCT